MTWPVRGVAKGVGDRWATKYTDTVNGLPGWTKDVGVPCVDAPVATGRTRLLVLGIGESGMVGHGQFLDPLPAGYPPAPDGRLWTYDTLRGWLPLVELTNPPENSYGINAGGLFCWRLSALLGSAYEVAFLPSALGGTTSVDWAVGGPLYNAAKANAQGALATPGTVLACIIHEQGINDAAQGIASGWAARWTAIESSLRADLNTSCPIYYARQHAAKSVAVSDSSQWSTMLAEQDSWSTANRVVAQKPEGPWVDGQTHLATSAQIVLSANYLASWVASPGLTG